jgi:anti-sigma factor RsiW
MTCRELADFLGDYLAGELGTDTRAAFEAHLRLCPNCRRYLASYEAAVRLGKRAFDDEDATLPADVPEDLVKAILSARSRQQS